MKPLQPILDMLEHADNPRKRAVELSKPKPTANKTIGYGEMEIIRLAQNQAIRQQAAISNMSTQMLRQGLAGQMLRQGLAGWFGQSYG